MSGPLYLTAQILLIITTAVLLFALYRALSYVWIKRGISPQKRQKLLRYTMLGFVLWLSFLGILAGTDYFANFKYLPARILVIAVFPPMVLTLYLMVSKNFGRTILRYLPGKWLIFVQSFRILVELILWLGLLGGFVPFQMTFEGLNFDIVVGITAIFAGRIFFGRLGYRKFEVFIWNVFGLALLMNIVIISVLSTPFPFRVFNNEPANIFVAYFPFIWIPGFLVPFAFAMHLFSIRQIFIKPSLVPEG